MPPDTRPRTVLDLVACKAAGRQISMLTCYDALFARLLQEAEIDVILVGDSLHQVLGGHETTLGATLDQMAQRLIVAAIEAHLARMTHHCAGETVLDLGIARAEDDQLTAGCDEVVDEPDQHVEALLRGEAADNREQWPGRVVDVETQFQRAPISCPVLGGIVTISRVE